MVRLFFIIFFITSCSHANYQESGLLKSAKQAYLSKNIPKPLLGSYSKFNNFLFDIKLLRYFIKQGEIFYILNSYSSSDIDYVAVWNKRDTFYYADSSNFKSKSYRTKGGQYKISNLHTWNQTSYMWYMDNKFKYDSLRNLYSLKITPSSKDIVVSIDSFKYYMHYDK